jgi:hypothetical protein
MKALLTRPRWRCLVLAARPIRALTTTRDTEDGNGFRVVWDQLGKTDENREFCRRTRRKRSWTVCSAPLRFLDGLHQGTVSGAAL